MKKSSKLLDSRDMCESHTDTGKKNINENKFAIVTHTYSPSIPEAGAGVFWNLATQEVEWVERQTVVSSKTLSQ